MPGPVQAAVQRALKTAKALCWVDVVYVAGDDRIQLRAVKSEADVEEIQADGTSVIVRVTDWRLLREDLVADGKQLKPARGHRIEWFCRSAKQTFEVMPAGGEPCYTPTDPWEYGWRIHSKLISES